MKPFQFQAELFEHRNTVLQCLADHDYTWLSDFGSVDMLHDVFGLEVCAIREKTDAESIRTLLAGLFPAWRHRRMYYEDQNRAEIGWKVMISRDPENFNDDWKSPD